MKKIYMWAGIALAAALVAAVWRYFPAGHNAPVMFEGGTSRRLDKDEARRMRRQIELPGDPGRPAPAANLNADVRRNLETIDQVNRINRMNKQQK